eukprot:TRINITY_DN10123_c0_g1_i1.p1 TRINITY_DN10123_c0_g1~~TRINITY_DN10123_c0_g1_i1.p1  ORF type:complete len:150 (-),score=42.78 TRINITY_DN10123_c0_g1_i1:107-556(-)
MRWVVLQAVGMAVGHYICRAETQQLHNPSACRGDDPEEPPVGCLAEGKVENGAEDVLSGVGDDDVDDDDVDLDDPELAAMMAELEAVDTAIEDGLDMEGFTQRKQEQRSEQVHRQLQAAMSQAFAHLQEQRAEGVSCGEELDPSPDFSS